MIGNSNYKNAPPLGNPGNDAKAIGETLRQSGFEVTVKLDASRDDLAAAMRAHVQVLAARKAVGLFYFAGHGLQLAWRNYLVPVDAAVRRLEDIQSACVDLTQYCSFNEEWQMSASRSGAAVATVQANSRVECRAA